MANFYHCIVPLVFPFIFATYFKWQIFTTVLCLYVFRLFLPCILRGKSLALFSSICRTTIAISRASAGHLSNICRHLPITSNIHEHQGQHSGNTASLHIQKPRTSTTAFRKVRVTPPPFPSNIQEHQHRVTPAPFTVKIQEHQEHHSGDTAALHNENPSTSTSGNTAALHIENSRTSTATFRKTRVTLPPFTSKIH